MVNDCFGQHCMFHLIGFTNTTRVTPDQIQNEQNHNQTVSTVGQSASMFQPEVNLSQQEVMSSSFPHETKPDVYVRRHSAPIASKKGKEDLVKQGEKAESEAVNQLRY